MPVHPEMIGGDEVYEPTLDSVIDAIGAHVWEQLPPDAQERVRQRVVEAEREKLCEEYRRFYA